MGKPRSYAELKLSVVFSFRNEEDVIPELVRRVRAALDQEIDRQFLGTFELIFVNDSSTDRSEALLKELAQGRDDIRIITMSRRFGVAPCVLAGMEYADGDLLVYMDADLQDPPEVIPEMLAAWRDAGDADVVHTHRLRREGESQFKLLLTKLGYWILTRFSSIPLEPEEGDFKLLSRRTVEHMIGFKEYNPFTRGLVRWLGFKQIAIQYERDERFAGETKFPIASPAVIRNFLTAALISYSDVPLQIASVVGLLSSVTAFGVLVHVLLELLRGNNLPGWTAVMTSVLFLGGIQLLAIGILGLYINNIFLQTKERPNYVVDRLYGFPEQEEPTPIPEIAGEET